jgi:hypothetical protein
LTSDDDAAPSSPAALRNRDPIAEVLREALPPEGLVLEVASGTGDHAEYFARLFPDLRWQPSDADPQALVWIRQRRAVAGLPNLMEPLLLDAVAAEWPVQNANAMLCINMVHISPWQAAVGLMRHAGKLLSRGAPLLLYGPYHREDAPTAPSNEVFDASLRARDRRWGLRTVEVMRAEADRNDLALERLVTMPANNLVLVFRRRG